MALWQYVPEEQTKHPQSSDSIIIQWEKVKFAMYCSNYGDIVRLLFNNMFLVILWGVLLLLVLPCSSCDRTCFAERRGGKYSGGFIVQHRVDVC